MTREEAVKIIATWLVSSKGAKGQRGYIEGWFDEEDVEAFRMAIEALSADTVSREFYEATIKVNHGLAKENIELKAQIESTDRPSGEWIITKEGEYDGRSVYKTECSECGHETFYKANNAHYCPNCGAKMGSDTR